jgi:hypothetical protein
MIFPNKLRITFTLVLLSCASITFAQNKTELFPLELNFKPFAANKLEPKLGFLFHLNENLLRLDVGSSMDILRIDYPNKSSLSFGADLFTYSRLRSEDKFKFPVEAIDYLFGLNAAYLFKVASTDFGVRLRLSHISAHLVDGRFDKDSDSWIDGRLPFVFSKEFVESMVYVKKYDLRFYIGYTYNYNIAPNRLGKDNYQLGFDYFSKDLIYNYVTPFFGYDFHIAHLDEYTYNHNTVAGIKIGKEESKGFSIFINYYSGRSFHGELYDEVVEYTALGMNFDL